MNLWPQVIKRTALACLAVALAFAWTGTGRTQSSAPCLVDRGQDPLDVLNSGVRHNVWVMLDTSGSMNNVPSAGGTSTKLEIAKSALNRLMDELVDGAGRPLVNWGFVNYANNRGGGDRCPAVPPDDNLDTFPDFPGACPGLNLDSFVNPGTCGTDSRAEVRAELDAIASGAGQTPIGSSFTQAASYLIGDGLTGGNTVDFVDGLLPNQKNFIIHLTDGEDTCECNTGGYPGNLTDPLEVPVPMRPSPNDPDATIDSTDASDFASFNAGLKGEFALRKIDPALDGSKGNIFVIGFDIQGAVQQRINTIAWMASGAHLFPQRAPELMNSAFFASGDDLVDTFRDILARIGLPETEVTLGAPIVASVREIIHSHTDTSVALEDVFPLSLGDGEAIREARVIRSDHRDNVLFTTSLQVPGFRGHLRAASIYRVTDPNLPRTAREADFTELWDAGVELQDDDPDARTLFFNRRGSTELLPFDTANVTPSDLGVSAGYLGALTDEDARDIVVQVIRGYRLVRDPVTKTFYDTAGELNFSTVDADGNPTWKLYESTAGAVAVVGSPPRSPDFDPPLSHSASFGVGGSAAGDGFFWDHFNRRTLVFYASNAGIMHAFDGETGAERFGFIPDDVVGLDPNEVVGSRHTLKDFVQNVVTENNNVINHRFTLSSPPNVEDVFLRSDSGGDDDWHTLLAFGRGRGGRFLTVLDITDAAEDPANLRLRWNRGNREGILEGQMDGLGETWSVPVFGNVDTRSDPLQTDDRVDQWLVFAGAGYGCDNGADEGKHLFAFRAEDGALYHRASVTDAPGAAIAQNALPATPTLFNPHEEDSADSKDFVTRVYVPDLHGQVWKLDTSNIDPGQWTMNVFASMGAEHPITAAVNVLNDPFDPNRVFVMAGSGGDRRAPVPPDGFRLRIWLDTDADGANTTQYGVGDAPVFEKTFNTDERLFVAPVTVGRFGDLQPPSVFFTASREAFDTTNCGVTFSSTLYAAAVTGGLPFFDLDSSQAGVDETSLGDVKAQGLFVRDRALYVTESGGLGTSGGVQVWGGDDAFQDDPPPSGLGQFTIQLLVEGFRISPF